MQVATLAGSATVARTPQRHWASSCGDHHHLSGGPRPGVCQQAFAVWKDYLFGLSTINGGDTPARRPVQLATNIGTQYARTPPVNVNATVRRVAPRTQRGTRSGLTEVPQIQGRPSVPVLSLHGIGDMQVPFSMEQIYRREAVAKQAGTGPRPAGDPHSGHCEVSPAEVGSASTTRQLGQQPGKPAGVVTTRHDPGDGGRLPLRLPVQRPGRVCRRTGTRRLYAACPRPD